MSSKKSVGAFSTPTTPGIAREKRTATSPQDGIQKPKAAFRPMDASAAHSTTKLQESMDRLLAGQLSMLDRLKAVEEQLDRFSNLSSTPDELKAHQESCLNRIEELEAKVADLQPAASNPATAAASNSASSKLNEWEAVKKITREEVELEIRRNNVVLSGISEMNDVSCESLVRNVLPDGVKLLDAQRLGSLADNITTSSSRRPRRILVRLTGSGKTTVLQQRMSLKYGSTCTPVYVNHDLTRREQETRRKIVPVYKKLRSKGVRCSLPPDKILLNGNEMSQQDICAALPEA